MNTNFKTICLVLLVCLGMNTYAQRNCVSMDVLEEQIQQDPKRQAKLDAIEAFAAAYATAENRGSSAVVTIPVVVHVIYNNSTENISDAQIMSQMTVLNDDFRRQNADADGTWSQAADTEIQFCMASVDPNGNPTNGITRTSTSVSAFGTNDNMKFNSSGGKDAWPASDYLNMWVCDISGGILGYAQFPGGAPATDGVVMDYQYFGTIGTATSPFDLGRTTTHEVGHWLNLRHIWGDGGCSVDDFVSDTPTSDGPNYGCAIGHVSCSSTDMVQNYMDYSDDACMNLFTQGQKTRMQATLAGSRSSLLSSNGCGSPPAPTCTDGIQNGDETGIDCGGSSCPPCAPCTDVVVTINLDNYPEETSWTITDAGGSVVASGGTYGSQPDGSTVSITNCLDDGCYDFNIFDSYGDGICCSYGTGSYTVTTGGSVVASGGSFGSSESTNFCVGGGPAPTCTDGIQNGSETGVDCGGPDCDPCYTCSDGIQNGFETGVDCGGPDCAPCSGGGCTDVTINNQTFESGWGIWNDGGSDCRRSANDNSYANGTYCVRLRDNTSTSTMTTDVLNLTGFEEVTIDFSYYPRSMENGEDFWLQASTNGGSTYSTLTTWARGTDFNNNTRYNESVVITGTFNNNIRFRFRNDASGNSDWVYIDDVFISGCVNSSRLNDPIVEEVTDLDAVVVQSIKTTVSDIMLYPNPTRNDLTVNFSLEEESNLEIMVTDLTGKVVLHDLTSMPAGQNQYRVDASELVSGIYILHIVDKANSVSRKFVVSK